MLAFEEGSELSALPNKITKQEKTSEITATTAEDSLSVVTDLTTIKVQVIKYTSQLCTIFLKV